MQNQHTALPKEAIEAAVNWWVNSLKHPQKDNGDDSSNGNLTALFALLNAADNRPTPEQLERFANALRTLLENSAPDYADTWLLGVDYHPEGYLADAAKIAGISSLAFSWKTRMWLGTKGVTVRAGYGADEVFLWQGE
jgi:hypothetical protein